MSNQLIKTNLTTKIKVNNWPAGAYALQVIKSNGESINKTLIVNDH